MATFTLTKKCFASFCKLARCTHTSSNNSKIGKNNPFSLKIHTLKSSAGTSKRSLQSIATVKDADKRHGNAICDPIAAGARSISTDPCLSNVTLGELREAKHQSLQLQEKILRWIWEGESWSVFAENDIQITKVKLLPTFDELKIYWSATGVQFMDKVIQESLDKDVAPEIKERIGSQKDFLDRLVPRIEFIADMSQIHASELAAGHHLQHPSLQTCNSSATELQKMKNQTGITSLKMVKPMNSEDNNSNFLDLEEDCIERSEVKGLDYHAVLSEILKNPTLRGY